MTAAHDFGGRAETAAADYLFARGYRILARKFTVRGGEIDIVAAGEDTVAFVEVKARGRMETALGAITPSKRARIARAAASWLAKNAWAADGWNLRGDAILLDARCPPLHIEDAFALEYED